MSAAIRFAGVSLFLVVWQAIFGMWTVTLVVRKS